MFSASLTESAPSICAFWQAAIQKKRLANAYLLVGNNQALKWQLCLELSQILNCHNGNRCGYCQSCLWFNTGSHPELPIKLEADPTKSKKGVVLVEQTQALLHKLQYKSTFFRVIWLTHTEREYLPPESANALLKTLEEPPSRTLFILNAQNDDLVLATIKSRCQTLPIPHLLTEPDLKAAQELATKLENPLSWFKLSSLAGSLIDQESNLPLLLEQLELVLLINNRLNAQQQKLLSKAKYRLRSFCSARSVLEELFYSLRS